ncbi:hypothetical protein B0H13DRAFT_1657593, partial [Mycena leptocephala]
LSFVFTGRLHSFSRDEVVDVAKHFGRYVASRSSSMTHYVVLGSNVGALKPAAIEKRGLKMLNERTSR